MKEKADLSTLEITVIETRKDVAFIKEAMEKLEKGMSGKFETIEKRLTTLETWKATIMGSFASISVVFTLLFNLIARWLQRELKL